MIDLDTIPYTPARYRRARTEPVVAVCIHTAESSETTNTAEVLAKYFATIARPAGIHYNVDCDTVTCSTKPEIETTPHCYKPSGWSVGIEHAGRAGQGTAGWADPYSQQMLRLSAELTAALCRRFAIPIVKLTPEQVRAKTPGIFGHYDATLAFAVAGGHTDPGPAFPWDLYLELVRAELVPPVPPPDPEDTMGATIAQLDTYTATGPVAVALDGLELRAINGGRFVGDVDPWRVVGLDGVPVLDVLNLAAIPIVGQPTDVLRSGVSTVTVWTRDDEGRRYAYGFQVATA